MFPTNNPFTLKARDRQKQNLYRDIEAHMTNPQESIPNNARDFKRWVIEHPINDATKQPITDNEIRAAMARNAQRLRIQIARMEFNLSDAGRRADLLEVLTDNGATEQDILDILTPLKAELRKQEQVSLNTPAKIIAECDRRINEFTIIKRLQD